MVVSLEGTVTYLGDIIAVGASLEELNQHLTQPLMHIKEYGFRRCLEKCQFFTRSTKRFGFVFDSTTEVQITEMYALLTICHH